MMMALRLLGSWNNRRIMKKILLPRIILALILLACFCSSACKSGDRAKDKDTPEGAAPPQPQPQPLPPEHVPDTPNPDRGNVKIAPEYDDTPATPK